MALIEFENKPSTDTPINANNLNNNFNELKNLIITSMFSISIGAINPQSGLYDMTYSFTTPTGYEPIGIIAINTLGSYSASLNIPKMYINESSIIYSVFNTSTTSTTDSTTAIQVMVLFKKIL